MILNNLKTFTSFQAHTLEDAPSAPPQKVACTALTAQNIQLSWESPPERHTHGVIQVKIILGKQIQ